MVYTVLAYFGGSPFQIPKMVASVPVLVFVALVAASVYTNGFVIQLNDAEQQTQQQDAKEKEQEEESQLIHTELMCNIADKSAPCACQPTLTVLELHEKDGKLVQLEFPEFNCAKNGNKHEERGSPRIPKGYTCAQLSATRWMYRDINNNPIDAINVRYKAACELRCLNEDCIVDAGTNGDKESSKTDDNEVKEKEQTNINNEEKENIETVDAHKRMDGNIQREEEGRKLQRLCKTFVPLGRLCKYAGFY